MPRRLLLISNSTAFGEGYLDHCEPVLLDFLGPIRSLLFVPFALGDRSGYTAKVRERLAPLGIEVGELTANADGRQQVAAAEAIFTGGGNTFRLLKTLRGHGLLDAIRRRVLAGVPYIGTSAGSNIAAPTIRTTNDMPIVEPDSFAALDLVAFQINPHYLDPEPGSKHMGETREQRLREYLEENDTPVLGLREGGWIRVEGAAVQLGGSTRARLFRRGKAPEELDPGADLSSLAGR